MSDIECEFFVMIQENSINNDELVNFLLNDRIR